MRFLILCVALLGALTFRQNATAGLRSELDENAGTLKVFREGEAKPILTQNARTDFRPYIHPIMAPDGKGELTQYSPGHHKHQTGLYWGFTRVNGRDYFHHPEGTHWRREGFEVVHEEESTITWRTVYELLEEDQESTLTETQEWTLKDLGERYELDLVWKGQANTEVTIGKYDYGGLFLRMPWAEGMTASVENAARERDQKAEGRRAMWLDVGMQVPGRDDLAHIAILDHSENAGFPQPWRVDNQYGVGPVRARLGDWKIEAGKVETIKHRLVAYTGKLDDVGLTEKWQDYSKQGGTWALWAIAQREGREAEFLTPDKAVEAMTLHKGFQVNAYASEPMITQPMAFCWDDHGRLWIAENRDYESRGHGFSNHGDSRVLILEDTDGDGAADTKQVFLEGIPFPAGIAVGFDGLWLGAPPNLLFVPDRNRDDKADMEDIEVRLTGWGIRDRHETLNSFHWGPDGWLYGCQGYATPSVVRKPKGKGRLYKHGEAFPKDLLDAEGTHINGGVWRYHPTKDRFEVVAHGFSNPWGIDYDAKGQIFITACVIPHLWHVIPGGIYHRQGGRHFNPYVYADIRTIADHRHRSAHGGARVYLSDAFPEKHHGRIFMANIHEHAVLSDILAPKGSGYVGHDGDDFLLANNAQWIGFSMELGPEGALYVLDWHDADICGKEVLNKETGRIFRINPKESLAKDWEGRYADLSTFDDSTLVDLQLSESSWHARRARVILQHRAESGQLTSNAATSLEKILDTHPNADWKLRALWALHVTKNLSNERLEGLLNHEDAHLRAWAIQLLCEDHTPSSTATNAFIAMASEDTSAVVRLYLAAAIQRVPESVQWKLAHALVQRGEDREDHNIPKMIWFGIESLVPKNPARAFDIASASQLPLVREFIARRLADANELETLAAGLGAMQTADAAQGILKGMRDGLEGRTDVIAPQSWPVTYAKLQKHSNPDVGRTALALAQQFGDTSAAQTLIERLDNATTPIELKAEAITSLASQQRPELKDRLIDLLSEQALRPDVIRAMAAFEEDTFAKALLKSFKDYSGPDQLEVLQTLSARPKYGWALTEALKQGAIEKAAVPAYVARQLRRVVGNGFVEVWGPIDALSADKEAAYTKYRTLLTNENVAKADPSHGRQVYDQTCGACHKMYESGGELGPELTGSNRANLEYLLANVIEPSSEIPEGYRMVLITSRDGRTYSGTVANEDDRQVTLRVVGQDPVIIAKSSIQSREALPVSMMPEGLFAAISDSDVLALTAYLRTAKQIPTHAAK